MNSYFNISCIKSNLVREFFNYLTNLLVAIKKMRAAMKIN